MSAARYTEWLTPSDWGPLVANGFATATKYGKQTIYKLSYDPIVDALVSELLGVADVDTVEQFKSESLTAEHFVFDVLGFPDVERSCPNGVDERDWLDPRVGMIKWLTGRLGTQFDRPVQKRVLEKGKVLVSGEKKITITTEGGHQLPQKAVGYAVTNTAEVIKAYFADPMVETLLRQERRRISHNAALINAAPEAAAVLIASLDVLATSSVTARSTVYDRAIEGLNPKQVAELDSLITEAVSTVKAENAPQLIALTDGSDE